MSVTQNPENGKAYALINLKGGTAADLSGGDNTSIIGYDYHGGENQQVCPFPYLHLHLSSRSSSSDILSS